MPAAAKYRASRTLASDNAHDLRTPYRFHALPAYPAQSGARGNQTFGRQPASGLSRSAFSRTCRQPAKRHQRTSPGSLAAVPLPPCDPASTALVTGASSGIGTEFARALAVRGHGVTLVARRADRLERLAKTLSDQYDIRAEFVTADLTDPTQRDRLAGEVAELGLTVEILVNNAGFGVYEPVAASDRHREVEQVRLLVEAVVDLDARYVPAMVERGRGAIVNVSSSSGFQPLPGNANYAASKAFVLFHGEALHEEVAKRGVTVTTVCPGPVRTEFQETSAPIFVDRLPEMLWVEAARVAEDGLRAAENGRRTVVPGGPAVRVAFAPNRAIPSAISLPVTRWMMSGELARRKASQEHD
jgi:short-subunit dehydrogenase